MAITNGSDSIDIAGNSTGWDFLSTPVTTTTLSMRLGFGL